MRRRTTALPAARLGANVLGVDIASNLVEAGNARARSLGIANRQFQEGDATDLHELEDDQFDLVVSIFERCSRLGRSMSRKRSRVSRGPAVES